MPPDPPRCLWANAHSNVVLTYSEPPPPPPPTFTMVSPPLYFTVSASHYTVPGGGGGGGLSEGLGDVLTKRISSVMNQAVQ